MADWSKPNNNSTKTNFPTEIRNIAISAIKMDPTLDTNVPVGARRYNSTLHTLDEWNGSTWNIIEAYPDYKNFNLSITASAGTWTPTTTVANGFTVASPLGALGALNVISLVIAGSLSTAAAEIYIGSSDWSLGGAGRPIAIDAKEVSTFIDARAIAITSPVNGIALLKKSGSNWAGSTAITIQCTGVLI